MKKLFKVLLTSIILVVLAILIILPQLVKRNPHILDTKNFTKEDLDTICAVELRHDEIEREDGITYQKLWNNRNIETKFDDLTFYLYRNKKDAKKVFNQIKKSTFSEVLDEGDNFVKGWEDGVIDANVISYYYLDKNLIVKTDLYVTSDWGMSPDGIIPGSTNDTLTKTQDEEEVIKMIKENF